MKRILIGIIVCSMFLTGCGRKPKNFAQEVALQNKGWFWKSVDISSVTQRENSSVSIENEDACLYDPLKKTLEKSNYKKYFKIVDCGYSIDWYAYVSHVLKKHGLTGTCLQDEPIDAQDRLTNATFSVDYEELKKYKATTVENCILFKDSQGRYLKDVYYVSLAKDKEFMREVSRNHLENLKEMLVNYDEILEKNIQDGKVSRNIIDTGIQYVANIQDCGIENSQSFYVQKNKITTLSRKAKWLYDYYSGDVWGCECSAHNKWCDFIRYSFSDTDGIQGEFTCNVNIYGEEDSQFGKNAIRMIVLQCTRKSVPKYGQKTMLNYMKAMGISQAHSEELLNHLPKKKGKTDGVHYEYDDMEETYKFYR